MCHIDKKYDKITRFVIGVKRCAANLLLTITRYYVRASQINSLEVVKTLRKYYFTDINSPKHVLVSDVIIIFIRNKVLYLIDEK